MNKNYNSTEGDIYSFYKTTSAKSRTLVLISGSCEGRSRWLPFIDRLIKHYNVLVIDNPGVGSAKYQSSFTADSLAVKYHGIIDRLGIQDYCLLGHSFGGFIAQKMAVNEPKRVSKLVLVGSSVGSVKQASILNFQIRFPRLGLTSLFSKNFIMKKKREWEQYVSEKSALESKVKLAYVLASAKESTLADLVNIKSKTLVVHGTDDAIISYDHGEQLATAISDASLLSYSNVGHYPYMEVENCFNDILSFLNGKQTGKKLKYKAIGPKVLKEDNKFKAATSGPYYDDNLTAILASSVACANIDEEDDLYNQYKLITDIK